MNPYRRMHKRFITAWAKDPDHFGMRLGAFRVHHCRGKRRIKSSKWIWIKCWRSERKMRLMEGVWAPGHRFSWQRHAPQAPEGSDYTQGGR